MNRLLVALQYLLPQHALSRLVRWLTRIRVPWVRTLTVRVFCKAYGVDLDDAESTRIEDYPDFNRFFTRALRPGARPVPAGPGVIVAPVDGTVSHAGAAAGGHLFQAKGHRYGLAELLGDDGAARALEGGEFVTLYLAPWNYHRVHMPVAGRLTSMRYIPGSLFSVNGATVAAVPRLFTRNQRVVTLFDTGCGPLALVLVGALNVGSIETVWAGEVAPGHPGRRAVVDYGERGPRLARGEEMGRFNMGSTVIVVFAPGRSRLDATLAPGQPVLMGQRLGEVFQAAE